MNAMVEVAKHSPVPIATGESFSNKQQFAELCKHDVVSIYQPEPLNLGGLFATRKIADMVDAHFGVVAPHSAQGRFVPQPAFFHSELLRGTRISRKITCRSSSPAGRNARPSRIEMHCLNCLSVMRLCFVSWGCFPRMAGWWCANR